MKIIKFILCSVLCFFCILMYADGILAEEEEYIYTLRGEMQGLNDDGDYEVFYFDYEFSMSYKMCMCLDFYERGTLYDYDVISMFFVVDKNGDIDTNGLLKNLSSDYYGGKMIKNNSYYAKYDGSKDGELLECIAAEGNESNKLFSEFCFKDPFSKDVFKYSCSAPIFDDKEKAIGYINGTVSEKEALNYESDISGIKYDLETPKNVKTKYIENWFDGKTELTWEQTDKNYINWETEFYFYSDFKYRNSILVFSWEDWKYVDNFFLFSLSIDTAILKFTASPEIYNKYDCDNKKMDAYPTDFGGQYEDVGDRICMRNKYYKDGVMHYSNWVIIDWVSSGDRANVTYTEKEGSGISVDDDGQVSIDDSGYVDDTQYDSDYVGHSAVSGNDILSWVNNGFGILGDNGILAIMSEAISFIPAELWSVFMAGMGIMVLIAIFKFARG